MDNSSIFSLLLIFGLLITGGLAIAIIVFLRRPQSSNSGELGALMERLTGLNEQNREMRKILDEKLSETHAAHSRQFGETTKIMQAISGQSAKLISDVTEKLTKLDETNRQVVNFSGQLQSLQDILKNPKQRGVLGEYYLETLLKNVMPAGSYQMQFGFPDGTIVDAAVFVKDKIIPIDSKFSLENYNRISETDDLKEKERLEKVFLNDLKNRIVETAKYIQPEKGTMDFAFMFIPHEAIYYDLIVNKIGAVTEETENLIQRAASKYKVIIVSPTSFLAYLQTVLQGLRAMHIEETAITIRANVEKLRQHLTIYDTYMQKLGGSMSTTVNHFNNAYKEFKKVDKDIIKITGLEASIENIEVEKPLLDNE
jgi:DNA recombination protein RmuC